MREIFDGQLSPLTDSVRGTPRAKVIPKTRSNVHFIVFDSSDAPTHNYSYRRPSTMEKVYGALQEQAKFSGGVKAYICPNGFFTSSGFKDGDHYAPDGIDDPRAWRARRFGAEHLRWLNALLIDLDESLMTDELAALAEHHPGEFHRQIMTELVKLGIQRAYFIVTNPAGGTHIIIPIKTIRADIHRNQPHYRMVGRSLWEVFKDYGADPSAAGSVTNGFRIPGVRREDYQGFRPYAVKAISGTGDPISMYDLKDSLREAGFSSERTEWLNRFRNQGSERKTVPYRVFHDRADELAGVQQGCRTITAYRLAVILRRLELPALEREGILKEWNARNGPPLRWCELQAQIRGAELRRFPLSCEQYDDTVALLFPDGPPTPPPGWRRPRRPGPSDYRPRGRKSIRTVKRLLLTSRAGELRGTVADQAKRAGVSVRTYRYAVKELERRQVLEASARAPGPGGGLVLRRSCPGIPPVPSDGNAAIWAARKAGIRGEGGSESRGGGPCVCNTGGRPPPLDSPRKGTGGIPGQLRRRTRPPPGPGARAEFDAGDAPGKAPGSGGRKKRAPPAPNGAGA